MYNTRIAALPSTTLNFQEQYLEEQQLGEFQQFSTSFCRALYDYIAQDPSALSFRRGDIIEILTRQPSGWWDGLLSDERGWFPSNYVVLISDEDAETAFAQAEIEAQAPAAAQAPVAAQTPLANDPPISFKGIQPEQQEWLDNELGKGTSNHDAHDVMHNGGQSSDFWMPEVTPDGQIYYVNTQTGQRSRYLPQEAEDDMSDGDLAGLSSTSRSGASAFGYSEASSESENDLGGDRSQWLRKLADDGVSYYYVNSSDGRVRWTAPQLIIKNSARSNTIPSRPETSRLSVYSDDSDVQPLDHLPPKSRSRQNTTSSSQAPLWPLQLKLAQMELTSAERIAKSLQQALEPPPLNAISDLSTVAGDSITALVDYVLSGMTLEEEEKMDQLVHNIVLAVRNLLYIAGAPSATSSYSAAPRDAKGLSSTHSSLKPSQRKVTASLSRLVLSARAIQYDSGSVLTETLARIETDSEELAKAVEAFVLESQRHERNQQPKEFPKRLHGVFETSNIGLGLLGGGIAGSWKGFGYLATTNDLDMPSKVLGTEVISEIDGSLSILHDTCDGLTQELRTPDADVRQILGRVQSLISQVASLLSLIADIHVARHVDIDGIRQGGDGIDDHYSLSVENARRLVRNLEAIVQAVYDDSSALLFSAQGLHENDCNGPLREHGPQFGFLESLSTSLSKNFGLIKQDLEALLSVGHEQADIAQGDYNGSIDWRMSRISAISERFNGMHNHTESYGSDNEDVIDMELALHRPGMRQPQSSANTSSDSHCTLANVEPAPHPTLKSDVSNDTLVTPSIEESQGGSGDDATHSLFEEAPPKPPRPSVPSNKLQRLLGDDAYDTYVNTVATDLQPWYLRPNYPPSDITIEPDGSVRGGTLPALVERLTAHEQADTTFSRAFLMTYTSFTSLDELFELLVARFRIQPPDNLDPKEKEEWGKLKQHVVQTRVLNTFKAMIIDEGVMEKEDYYILGRMKEFVSSDEVSKSNAAKQLLILIERAQRGQGDVKMLVNTPTAPPPSSILPKANKKLKLLDIDHLELARQLTIVESLLYQKIKPIECLTRSREQKPENSDNISNSIQTSNRIADWVADSILCREEARRRAQVIKHLILIADRCRGLNNFSTMAAIISGLNTPPIRRLKRTWEQVNQRLISQFEACNAIIDSNKNFTKYKQVLAQTAPPCVPFIGPYLTNLEFIQVGNKDTLPSGLINFRKRQKASEVINDVKRWQSQPYNLQVVPIIQTYISESLGQFNDTKASSDHFWALSLEREPKEREDEKMARLLQESGFL